MAGDLQDVAKHVMNALKEADDLLPDLSRNGRSGDHGLSGMKGIAAGAGAAALLPLAARATIKRLGGDGLGDLGDGLEGITGKLGDSVSSSIGDKVSQKVDEAGGPTGILKNALPFGGGDDSDDEDQDGASGYGKGRRMPVQQSVDIGAPIETVYNQWTQFEEWPKFMHRVTQVTQEDQCTVSFSTKIWGKTKEFTATIETQRPDERVKWNVSQGMAHTGVVTFHELGPRLTRVLLNLDVEPGGMLEKLARGARHIKRAARGDLHRFKAYVEMSEEETGAWRGVIEDGEVVAKGGSRSGSSSRRTQRSGSNGSSRGRSGSSRSKSASASSSSKSSSASRSGSSSGGSRSGSSGSRSSRRRSSH